MPDLLFPDQQHLLHFAGGIDENTLLREQRWAKQAGSQAWMARLPEAHPALSEALALAKMLGAKQQPASSEADWRTPRDWFHRAPVQAGRTPRFVDGNLFVVGHSTDEHAQRHLIDVLSQLEGFRVERSLWRTTDDVPVLAFELESRGFAARPPRIERRVASVLQPIGLRGVFHVPLGARHPMSGLVDRLFLGADAGKTRYVCLDASEGWTRLRHGSDKDQRLTWLVDLDRFSPAVERVMSPSGEDARLSVPLALVADRTSEYLSEFDHEDAAAQILLFKETQQGVPTGPFLEVLDLAQAGVVDDVRYMATLEDPEQRRKWFGTRHYVWVGGDGDAFADVRCSARFLQPEAFHANNLRIYIREGFRFRPDLARMLEKVDNSDPLVAKIAKTFELDDEIFAVLIGPSSDPTKPIAHKLLEGQRLRDSILPIFDRWAPHFLPQLAGAVEEAIPEELERTYDYAAKSLESTLDEILVATQAETVALAEKAQAMKSALLRAREHLKGIEGIDAAFQETLRSAADDWGRFVGRVGTIHAQLAARAEEWGVEVDQEAAEPLAVAGRVIAASNAAMKKAKVVRSRVAEQAGHLGRVRDRSSALQQEIERTRKRLQKELPEGLRAVSGARERADEAKRDIEPKLAKLRSEIEHLREEHRELSGRLRDLESDIEAKQEQRKQNEAARRDIATGEQTLAWETRQLETEQSQLKEARQRLPGLNAKLDTLKAEVQPLRPLGAEAASVEARVARLREELERLQAAKQRKQQAMEDIDTLRQEQTELHHMIGQSLPSRGEMSRRLQEKLHHGAQIMARAVVARGPTRKLNKTLKRLEMLTQPKRDGFGDHAPWWKRWFGGGRSR